MDNQVLQNILHRRSVRNYKAEQISEEELSAIIEAGRYAPSGGNNQTAHFVAVQAPQILSDLKALMVEEFRKMTIAEDTYPSIKSAVLQAQKGNYDFIYNAPALVILTNKRGYGNAMADCAVAIENIMLAASSIGVGSCWINQLRWLADNEAVMSYLEKLQIGREEIVCGSVSLGYPASSVGNLLPRKGNLVTIIK